MDNKKNLTTILFFILFRYDTIIQIILGIKKMNKAVTEKSKYISYVLRHGAKEVGIDIDSQGWVLVADLMDVAARNKKSFTREELDFIVENNNKKRFVFSSNGLSIRASQGHSSDNVSITFEPKTPPESLYHGTTVSFVDAILAEGLKKMSRHHVHLSQSLETAISVGSRHGKVAMLKINSRQMQRDGFSFYCSANNVWLTDNVPSRYIERVDLK